MRMYLRLSTLVLSSTLLLGFFAVRVQAQERALKSTNERSAAEESPATVAQSINLPIQMIPAVKEPLPILKLEALPIPREYLSDFLKTAAPGVKELAPLSKDPKLIRPGARLPEEILGAFENGHLAAYADQETGNIEVYPSLLRQKAVPLERAERELNERARALAQQIFSRSDVLGKDDTQWTLGTPSPMLGSRLNREDMSAKSSSAPTVLLTYVAAHRTVHGFPVYGPGSRALIAVGTDGSPQGLVRYWKTATSHTTVQETRSAEQVRQAILEQLAFTRRGGEAEVLSVTISYFDGNADYLQPVYRFTARIHQNPSRVQGVTPIAAHTVADDIVVGYVPIGAALEPLPSLGAPSGPPPVTAAGRVRASLDEKATVRPGDPTVGRYVVRNDDPGWVNDANAFWDGLNPFFGAGFFTNSQYYWAYPFEFNSDEHSFVNSVNVALNEVHGNWWFFTTYQDWGDGVDITAIPAAEGYGPAAGGQLDYWILHSCEVIPSAEDAPCPTDSRPWWTPWFNVFQGLHSAVGYRTIMYINDGVGGPYGQNLWFGIPVVSAWFNAVESASDYSSHPTSGAHCLVLPMGRPSTVSVCGHEDDSVYDTAAIPAAGCLVNYWIPN